MSWYDLFSRFYDRSLEHLYVEQRQAAAQALELISTSVVLDVPCGTGQSFDVLAPAVPSGHVFGVDASAGMLAKARARANARGLGNVTTVCADVHALDGNVVTAISGEPRVIDRVHVFLGLSAFPRWELAFDRVWDTLAPGGMFVAVDVHAATLGVQGRMVNLVAQADIRRAFWQPLERVASDYARHELPSRPEHGGKIFLAKGRKPNP